MSFYAAWMDDNYIKEQEIQEEKSLKEIKNLLGKKCIPASTLINEWERLENLEDYIYELLEEKKQKLSIYNHPELIEHEKEQLRIQIETLEKVIDFFK